MTARFEIARAIGSGSAGVFRPDEPSATDQPAFPQLATPAVLRLACRHTGGRHARCTGAGHLAAGVEHVLAVLP